MTTELIPLAVYPWPISAEDASALAAAGKSLNLPYSVKFVQAVIASPSRILALREAPPWLDDFRGSADPQNDPELAQKIAWVLDSSLDDPKASLIIDQLNELLGPGVVELFDVEGGRQSPEAQFAAANANAASERRSLDSMVD